MFARINNQQRLAFADIMNCGNGVSSREFGGRKRVQRSLGLRCAFESPRQSSHRNLIRSFAIGSPQRTRQRFRFGEMLRRGVRSTEGRFRLVEQTVAFSLVERFQCSYCRGKRGKDEVGRMRWGGRGGEDEMGRMRWGG